MRSARPERIASRITCGRRPLFPGIARREATSHEAASAMPIASIHSVGRMPMRLGERGADERAGRRQEPGGDLPGGRGPAERLGRQQPLPQRRFVDEVDGERAVADRLASMISNVIAIAGTAGASGISTWTAPPTSKRADQRPARAPARRGGRRERGAGKAADAAAADRHAELRGAQAEIGQREQRVERRHEAHAERERRGREEQRAHRGVAPDHADARAHVVGERRRGRRRRRSSRASRSCRATAPTRRRSRHRPRSRSAPSATRPARRRAPAPRSPRRRRRPRACRWHRAGASWRRGR